MTTEKQIDTFNYQFVGMRGSKVIILRPPQELTKDQALAFAAYLVLMTGDYEGVEFGRYLAAIREA